MPEREWPAAFMKHPIANSLAVGYLALMALVGIKFFVFPDKQRPLSAQEEAEARHMISRQREDEARKCIENVNKTYQYWPKDMQKLAGEVRRKCWDND
jgi:hypothetical protein